ncbi:bifunctional 5,10-methylenetetrahydrofolate dehydrogenase/5,10-methenyltetrahydrofolate cyclohydrolase [Candidatus Micrarchaeota archaeon]|nr:bifunctional 5,10-methylenetetrahydrofolate dehydrogenase/5,10-methenyltetrahydrofolate cyclohydrolase [Candidatus Micrarchaeota archaeon]
MYKTLTGREPAEAILSDAKRRAQALGRSAGLAIVLVGSDPASELYVKKKLEKAASAGVNARLEKLPETATESEVLRLVKSLNRDTSIDGFIVQAPLPKQIDPIRVLEAIEPGKDVDGWTSANLGKLAAGMADALLPATPLGVMKMLEFHGAELRGKHAVVIGRSNVVGKPLALLLLAKDATVTICHSKTQNLAQHTKSADILIAAAGVPNLVKADMVKSGAFVIDVGTTRVGGKTQGDVDFPAVIKKANCSPVPGGVGPLTVAILISNVIEAASRRP